MLFSSVSIIVNSPAGLNLPINLLSLISTFSKFTLPVPLARNSKLLFVCVVDIEVGLIANKIYSPRNDFCIYKTNSICRNKKFISDIQFYILGIDELIHILNLPEDICIKIYDYIPHLFKMNRFRSSFNFYCNKNLLENGSDYNYD